MINKKINSRFLHNEACPSCKEKGKDYHGDNLGVFDDGHKYCWSCGYFERPSIKSIIHNMEKVNSNSVLLTKHTTVNLEEVPTKVYLKYLNKYGILLSEVKDYSLGYNKEKELLVFHYPDWSFYSGRYVGDKSNKKYLAFGSKFKTLFVFNGNSERTSEEVILVEDYISAIKVGRVCSCLCLFGSHIPLELIIRLSKRFSKVGIWLDIDKAKESLVERFKASHIMEVRSIITEKDPKCYSTEEIKIILDKRES